MTRQILGLTRRAGRSSQLGAAPWRRGCNGFVPWIGDHELSGGRLCEGAGIGAWALRQAAPRLGKLFLIDGDFGRFDNRENFVAFFQIHSLNGTGCDNRCDCSSCSFDDNFRHNLIRNNLLDCSRQAISNANAHRDLQNRQIEAGANFSTSSAVKCIAPAKVFRGSRSVRFE